MSLDPLKLSSWKGFVDLLRPPAGFRLKAAAGTTFGLSFDALVAVLLSMIDSGGEGLEKEPLAGLLAATRLSTRVRVFVHAGSIYGSTNGVPARLAALLDRLIVPLRVNTGVFHPKLWVASYCSSEPQGGEGELVRVLVGSRNLTRTNAFEIGAVFDGEVTKKISEFGNSVADAIDACHKRGRSKCDATTELTEVVRRTRFHVPDEGADVCDLLWQGWGGKKHVHYVPTSAKRAIVLSPFLSADFIDMLLTRTQTLRVVSTPTAFSCLKETTFASLEERAVNQKFPSMYVVREDFVKEEDQGHFDGLHAKMLIVDQGKGRDSSTFLGSANASGQGWGTSAGTNVECLAHLAPGIPMDAFVSDFLLEARDKPRPWIDEFLSSDRTSPSPEEIQKDALELAGRDLAGKRFRLTYDPDSRRMTISLFDDVEQRLNDLEADGVRVYFAPHALLEEIDRWDELRSLLQGPITYSDVDLSTVSGFVAIRVTPENGQSVTRLALCDMDIRDRDLIERDHAARQHLLANARPEDILMALMLGVGRLAVGAGGSNTDPSPGGTNGPRSALFTAVSLEAMLKAVAANPDLLHEMRLLLGGRSDPLFAKFQSDLEAALSLAPARV